MTPKPLIYNDFMSGLHNTKTCSAQFQGFLKLK